MSTGAVHPPVPVPLEEELLEDELVEEEVDDELEEVELDDELEEDEELEPLEEALGVPLPHAVSTSAAAAARVYKDGG